MGVDKREEEGVCVYLYPHTDTLSLITKEETVVKKRRLHLYQIISRRMMIMRIYNIEWNRGERIQFETKSSRKLLTETKGNYCLFRSLINLVVLLPFVRISALLIIHDQVK